MDVKFVRFMLVLQFSCCVSGLVVPRRALPVPTSSYTSLVESIDMAVEIALGYCQKHFKWDRWNCPDDTFLRHSKLPANRETAFTKAILAASLVHTITKNCSRGEIKDCLCGPSLKAENLPIDYNVSLSSASMLKQMAFRKNYSAENETLWFWGSCSDNTKFADNVTRLLLEDTEKGTDMDSFVGKHNYRVGRQIVRDTMVKRCRCHGVSGSCSLRTCWMQVATFHEISQKLRDKYRKAIRITHESVKSVINFSNSIKQHRNKKQISLSRGHLAYLEQSPDYCVANEHLGWSGTKGRICMKNITETSTVAEKRSCRNLCRQCGYKVKKQKKKVSLRCNCNFIWCCDVQCDTCEEIVEEHFCD